MKRFYTLPPSGCDWPYLLVNPNNYRVLYRRRFEHAILDCGVEAFKFNPHLKDYPRSFLEMWKRMARRLTETFGDRLFVTVPDYPDDFNPGQFGDNVSKTLRNVEEFMAVDGVNWLVPIQGRYMDKFSFLESCQRLREIVGDYPRLAIGTVCKTNNLDFIAYCCRAARVFFPRSWIHAFGLTLTALPKVANAIDSFDSMAWTFPRGRGGHSCRNRVERARYFYAYLKKVEQFVGGTNTALH